MSGSLAAIDVTIGYGRRIVGRGISLSFAAGEVVALLGPNGGGKTTLFRTLLGLIPALGGRVLLDGDDVADLPRTAVARRVAYVPQAHTGYFPFAVIDVVTMARTARLSPFAVPSRSDRERARDALSRAGIAHLADAEYTRISGGERQLVLIARAIAQEAPLIVMDEPTASLDFGNRARVLAEIRRLQESGLGILLSTHDPDQAFELADRVAMLHDGALVADDVPLAAITPQRLHQVYSIEVAIVPITLSDGTRRSVCVPSATASTARSRPA